MKLNPIGEWVVIEPIKENISKDGIHLPDKVADKLKKGKVLAVGPGLSHGHPHPELYKVPVKEGDTVIFQPYSTTKLHIDGEDVHLVMFTSIIAVVEEED